MRSISNDVIVSSTGKRLSGTSLDLLRTSFVWAFDGPLNDVFLDCKFLGQPIAAWLIRTGGVLLRYGSQTCTARAGQWIFPAAIDGWQRFSPGSSILSVRFAARWLDHSSLFDHSKPLILESTEYPELEAEGVALATDVRTKIGNVHETLWAEPATLDTHFAIQSRFQGWMGAYLRSMQQAGCVPHIMDERDGRLVAAMHHLEEHPLSKPLRESDVARAAGLSASQLDRLFSRHYNTTPKRRFDTRREEFASNALRFSNVQVKSIAYQLGFSSLPHFTKWFHRRTGVSPIAYRRDGRRPAVVCPVCGRG